MLASLSFHIDDFIQDIKYVTLSLYIPDNKNVKTKPEIRLKHFPYKINNSIFVCVTPRQKLRVDEKQKPSFIYIFLYCHKDGKGKKIKIKKYTKQPPLSKHMKQYSHIKDKIL